MSKKREKAHGYDDGSYVTPKRRKFSFLAFILCMLIAFSVWVYATNKANRMAEENEADKSEALYTQVCPDASADAWA